jgi:hypothetical protein
MLCIDEIMSRRWFLSAGFEYEAELRETVTRSDREHRVHRPRHDRAKAKREARRVIAEQVSE